MRNRVTYVILAMALCCCSLMGCSFQNDTEIKEDSKNDTLIIGNVKDDIEAIEDLTKHEIDYIYSEEIEARIDNETPLIELLTAEYELKELYDFFGENICHGDRMLDPYSEEASSLTWHTWDEVNARYPVQCLRRHWNTHYSVYKVKNGGLFYVFWDVPIKGLEYMYSSLAISTYTSVYIDQLSTASSFVSILEDQSTASDVAEIDPCMDLDLLGSTPRSYSLMKNNQVMVFNYSISNRERNFARMDELIVDYCEIVSKDNANSETAAIFARDLPWQNEE